MAATMTTEDAGKHTASPAPTTPGKPKEEESRQQRAPDQTTQTGNPSVDRSSSDVTADPKTPKPPGPK
jgi:hypothetical protein